MKKWKILCEKILFLPIWLILCFVIISAATLLWVFLEGKHEHPMAYGVYVFSFYTLTVLCSACFTTLPSYYKKVKSRVYENRYASRYLTDVVYKTHVNLYTSLAVNLLYITINVISAVLYKSHWFAIFAIYYSILAVMHFLLVRYMGKNHIGESRVREWKRARTCACLLMTVNITLSGVVLMMSYYGRGFVYQGYFIYAMAAYTFYVTATAIKDVIKYRQYQSPVMSVTKIIKLAASLFSMLFLETAMFAQFGQDTSERSKRIMIMATGAGICVMVVGMSVYVIVRSSREIQEYRKNQDTEKKE